MPFIGKQPTSGFASIVKDDLTGNGTTGPYTLSKQVANANDIAVFVGNVRQEPTDAYTVNGNQLTMTGTVSSSVNFYVLHIAGTLESSVVPADGTITSAKLTTSAVTTAKIADNNVTVAKLPTTMDLSSNTVTLNKNASALVHIATIDASPSTSTYEWTMDYDDYSEFILQIEQITGSSSAVGENLDVKFKLNGTLDGGASTPYNVDNINLGNGTVRNVNNTDNMEWMTTNHPIKHWRGTIHCVNFGTDGKPLMTGCLSGNSTNALASFQSSNDIETTGQQVTAMRIAFTAGNVDIVKMRIYGVKK